MTRYVRRRCVEVLEAFAPGGGDGLAPLPSEVDYAGAFERMRRGSTWLAAAGLTLGLLLAVTAPLWLCGRLTTFGRLPPAERTRLLARLLSHETFAVRELTLLLKLCAAMALLGTPSVRARSGYDRDVPARAARASVRHALPLAPANDVTAAREAS